METIPKVETITPAEAGKIIGKSPDYIRVGLQQKRFDFGSAVQGLNGQWIYNIIKSKFYEYAGISNIDQKQEK